MSELKQGVILFSAAVIYAWAVAFIGTQIFFLFEMPIYKILTVCTCALVYFALMIATAFRVTKTNP